MTTTSAAHRFSEALWYGGSPWAVLLLPFSLLFGAVSWLRRLAYRSGLRRSVDVGVPVIVVGNISAGGTGKTPVVAWLASALQHRGYRPAIVSRGYGATPQRQPLRVSASSNPAESGDEPVLLARLTGAPVFVAIDRAAAAAAAVADGADVIIADDGLQHYRMQRAAEIAVVDGSRAFGNGWLLPAGPLREPVARLATVDHVLINGAGGPDGTRFELQPGAVVNLNSGEQRELSAFAGTAAFAVAGIGNPQRFYDVLSAAGISVVPVAVADHGRADLSRLVGRSEADAVFMTEKDAVKYAAGEHPAVWYVPVSLVMNNADEETVLNDLTATVDRAKQGDNA